MNWFGAAPLKLLIVQDMSISICSGFTEIFSQWDCKHKFTDLLSSFKWSRKFQTWLNEITHRSRFEANFTISGTGQAVSFWSSVSLAVFFYYFLLLRALACNSLSSTVTDITDKMRMTLQKTIHRLIKIHGSKFRCMKIEKKWRFLNEYNLAANKTLKTSTLFNTFMFAYTMLWEFLRRLNFGSMLTQWTIEYHFCGNLCHRKK